MHVPVKTTYKSWARCFDRGLFLIFYLLLFLIPSLPPSLPPRQTKAPLRLSPADGNNNNSIAHTCRSSDSGRHTTSGDRRTTGIASRDATRTRAASRRLRTASAAAVIGAVFAYCCSSAPLKAEAFFLPPTTTPLGRAHRYSSR